MASTSGRSSSSQASGGRKTTRMMIISNAASSRSSSSLPMTAASSRSSSSSLPMTAPDGTAHQQYIDTPGGKILLASMTGDIPGVRKLAKKLQAAGKSVEEAVAAVGGPTRGRGPLHTAAWVGKVEMCKFLIKDLRADVNGLDADGVSPLHFAIYAPASIAIARLLLDRGADPNKADRNGLTPLHTATYQDVYEIAELLLSRGAYVDPVCEEEIPLHFADKDGNSRMMLESLFQPVSDDDKDGRLYYTPLTLAVLASSLKCVKLLIKAGANVNAGNRATPLIAAAIKGSAPIIKCLLKAGADANVSDEIGRMPIEIAAVLGWKEAVEILFPLTSRIAGYPDWSIDGLLEYSFEMSDSDTTDDADVSHENNESSVEEQGDVAFQENNYALASALYTMAMETDTDDSTLYAKRSLCRLHLGQRSKALDDANTYKEMGPDLSKSCNEQGAALILVKDYKQACKALMSGLKLDFGIDQVDKTSRKEQPGQKET